MLHFFLTTALLTAGPLDSMRVLERQVKSMVSEAGCDSRLRGVMQEAIDYRSLSQRSLGSHWKRLSPEQRTEFVRDLAQVVQESVLSRCRNGVVPFRTAFLGSSIKGSEAEVRCAMVSGQEKGRLLFRLEKTDRWRVFDVVIDGTSLMRSYRAQFQKVIASEGFSGLMRRLQAKLAKLKKK